METIFMNTENSKTNEPHKFVFNLSQRLIKGVQINMQLFKIHLFITREKNIRKRYENNKLKVLGPTLNMNLKYQMVLILFQIFKISNTSLKSMKTLTAISPIHIYIN